MKKCKHPQCLVEFSQNAPDFCPDHNEEGCVREKGHKGFHFEDKPAMNIETKKESREMAYRIRLPKSEEARRCVLIVIENHIGVIEKIDGEFANVLKYKDSVRRAWGVQLKANLKGKRLIDFISLEIEEAQHYAKETWAPDMYDIVPVEIHY